MNRRILGILSTTVYLVFAACSTTVTPPSDPANPATIYILDHHRTSSLLVPLDGGGMIRYAYGEWDYYALAKNSFWDGLQALFWPGKSTYGRMVYPALREGDEASVRQLFDYTTEEIFSLTVEREDVARLNQRMDAIFNRYASSYVENPLYDLNFIQYPKRYSIIDNSNRAVADWLEELGCEVHGSAIFSEWQIRK